MQRMGVTVDLEIRRSNAQKTKQQRDVVSDPDVVPWTAASEQSWYGFQNNQCQQSAANSTDGAQATSGKPRCYRYFAAQYQPGEGCRHKEKQIVHYQVDHDHLLGLLVIPV